MYKDKEAYTQKICIIGNAKIINKTVSAYSKQQ